MEKIILTGDRPTGKLHLGHYVGSILNRIKLQNEGNYDEMYIMIADAQALTDNFDNPKKVRDNVLEVALFYLACGIDPKKVTIFIQSEVSALTELTFYYMNLVTLSRLMRNPTVKSEIKLRGFEESIPSGFLNYPVSQAADITAFNSTIVPVGDDQLPMIEQTKEIVHSFNRIYGDTLVEPKEVLPDSIKARRLPGIDGKAKMSKSLGNCIYLDDSNEEINKKVMQMYTDPNHIKVTDPGKVEGNVVFTYLDVFCKDDDFQKYLPEYKNLDELKNHYKKGGLGDVTIKRFLSSILCDLITPIREKKLELINNLDYVLKVLEEGTKKANIKANETLKVAIGDNRGAHRIFKMSLVTFGLIGLMGTCIMFFGARYISNVLIQIPEAELTMVALAPAIFFVAIASVIRGYFNGIKSLKATANSQTLEQVFKTFLTLLIVEIIAIFTKANTTLMAAGATVATTLATFLSFGYLYLYYKSMKKSVWQDINASVSTKKESIKKVLSRTNLGEEEKQKI